MRRLAAVVSATTLLSGAVIAVTTATAAANFQDSGPFVIFMAPGDGGALTDCVFASPSGDVGRLDVDENCGTYVPLFGVVLDPPDNHTFQRYASGDGRIQNATQGGCVHKEASPNQTTMTVAGGTGSCANAPGYDWLGVTHITLPLHIVEQQLAGDCWGKVFGFTILRLQTCTTGVVLSQQFMVVPAFFS